MPELELFASSVQALMAFFLFLGFIAVSAHVLRQQRNAQQQGDTTAQPARSQEEEALEQSTQAALDALPVALWTASDDKPTTPLTGPRRLDGSGPSSGHLPVTVAGTVELLQSLSAKLSARTSNSDIEECSLCLQPFMAGERVTTLPCCHFYHTECIGKWFASKAYQPRAHGGREMPTRPKPFPHLPKPFPRGPNHFLTYPTPAGHDQKRLARRMAGRSRLERAVA